VSWYVDHGLGVLIAQWRARHPGAVVGTIADAAHQAAGHSDHIPEADGSVDAADFMVGGVVTRADVDQLVAQLVAGRDPRIAYLIWQRRIISSTVAPWEWRTYSGADPHTGHAHLSVNDLHENDLSPWNLGDDVEAVKLIQSALKEAGYDPGAVDGDPGPKTLAAFVAALHGKTGRQGPIGLTGPPGPPGKPGTLPAHVTISGTLTAAQ
jgi:hypothetical protein